MAGGYARARVPKRIPGGLLVTEGQMIMQWLRDRGYNVPESSRFEDVIRFSKSRCNGSLIPADH